MRRTSQTSLIALATACAFAATPAFAQVTGDTDTPAQDATQPVADSSEGVADIVVTATRRSENLQDIPLSVATVSDETLAAVNSGGADIRGLSGRVPSLPRFERVDGHFRNGVAFHANAPRRGHGDRPLSAVGRPCLGRIPGGTDVHNAHDP